MIELVSITNRVAEGGPVVAAAVDNPALGSSFPGYGLEIAGWVVAPRGAVDRIEILHGEVVVRATVLSEARTDVSPSFGLLSRDALGFRTRINLLGLPLRPTLRVAAKIAGERYELAELVLRREPLRVSSPPPIHPLIVTTPGRTGSVWLSRLVGEHPAVVSYRPFESEPRMGSYWAHVLSALTDPASIVQGIAPLQMRGLWWLGQEDLSSFPRVRDPEVAEWLAEDHPERTARFCLESASDFYARVATLKQKTEVRYYAEKYHPSFVPSLLLELDPAAKEVFLVRDPRDLLASVVAWTSAGRAQFSEDAATAEEYLDWLSPQTKNLLRHWRARSEQSLLIRYEDLVLDPESTLACLFEYIGIDSSAETVADVLDSARQATPKLQRQHQTSKNAERSVGRWRRDIRADLWERLDDVFAPELESWYGEVRAGDAEAVRESSGG